ncbi:hypothetical protein INT45_013582, partial [Circinella minor]
MFLNMKIYDKMDNNNVMAMDGGYTLFINKFIELSKLKNKEFENNNFVFPICKDNKIKLTEPEKHFNNVFGSFRSKIENQFAELACLLKNITKFVELFNIPILPHHKLWEIENFEFPSEKNLIDIVITNEE